MSNIIPLYYQIKNTLKEWIVNREYNPGDKLPSENELAKKFNVNRLTLRRATALLIQEGLLIARQGEGTFVTEDEKLIDSFNLEFSGFMDDLFYQISLSKTKSVEIDIIDAPNYVAEKLELNKSREKKVVCIKRVRHLRGKSFAYTVNYLPLAIGEKIKKSDLLQRPMLQILEDTFGIEFSEAFQTIEASFAPKKIASLLEIEAGSPILFVERTMYDKMGKPVELVRTSYRSDLYKYMVRLRMNKGRHGATWIQEGN